MEAQRSRGGRGKGRFRRAEPLVTHPDREPRPRAAVPASGRPHGPALLLASCSERMEWPWLALGGSHDGRRAAARIGAGPAPVAWHAGGACPAPSRPCSPPRPAETRRSACIDRRSATLRFRSPHPGASLAPLRSDIRTHPSHRACRPASAPVGRVSLSARMIALQRPRPSPSGEGPCPRVPQPRAKRPRRAVPTPKTLLGGPEPDTRERPDP